MSFKGLVFTVFLVLTMATQAARAHSFDVAIVATTDSLADVLAGFRVATRERDGHANEESDGHLGGLDVYMLPVDAGASPDAVLAQAGAADIVLLTLGETTRAEAIRAGLSASGPFVMTVGSLPGSGNWREAEGAASFSSRYEAEFSRTASLAAAQGYNAARRIDLAVRSQGGADDAQALAEAFEASLNGIDW